MAHVEDDRPAEAEGHFKAHRDACEQGRWDDALAALRRAVALEAGYEPFPFRRYEPTAVLGAGGVEDHVHLLISIGREVTLADMMRVVKANSSRWVHEHVGEASFAWQSGYGAFGVSQPQLETVRNYIARQEQHHKKMTFQDEFRHFPRNHALKCEEKYVWD